jgi:hypothetical protein
MKREAESYMKKLRSNTGKPGLKKVACTVSAAALMLGVDQAATVGFNFQCNYNGPTGSYSGAYVTATAFGIATNGWESLTQMGTGYSTQDNSPLVEVIDTTTSSGGLNPLPNGSLTLNWSAYTANVSGFGGYESSPPHYSFGGTGHQPGEQEVYWGFLRDGVNFGPGSSGGDNNQPGYSIDIKGLKSVFTNTPFVIELVASADSMQDLTNAFIITPINSTTQSVIYPSTPPVANSGDTAWIRGIGGGLSTVSGPVNQDEVMIVGNRAGHAPNPGGYNHASTIAGFIITDKPVVTMSPQPVFGGPGDTVTLAPYAIGVPPLAYQWRRNGTPISGATSLSYTIAALNPGQVGNYDLVVANSYGSTTSRVAAVTEDLISAVTTNNIVADSNPSNMPCVGANQGAIWLASNSDGTHSRSGVMQFVATNSDAITVGGTTNFDVSTGTIMFWMRSAGTDQAASGNIGAALFGRPLVNSSLNSGNGLILIQQDNGGILSFNAPADNTGGSANSLNSQASISDNKWHLVVLTFDASATGGVTLYIDGHLDSSNPNSEAWASLAGQPIELGSSSDTYWRSYDGLLDDVRFYSRQLSAAEVASVYSSASLVDTVNLQMRLNFDTPPGPGFILSWRLGNLILQSAPAVQGPYVDLPAAVSPYSAATGVGTKFYRYRGYIPKTTVSNPYLM